MMPDYMKFFRDRLEASKHAEGRERAWQVDLAMVEYTNARMVTPIGRFDYEETGDPLLCRLADPERLPATMIAAFDEGGDLQAAFDSEIERADIVWRPMTKEERATPGQLLGLMSAGDRETAMRLLGTAYVAKAMAKGGGFAIMDRASHKR